MSKWYRSGTVTVTNGSSIITGSLSYWNTAVDKPEAGDIFTDNANMYEIMAVNSDTSITLDRPYEGTSGSKSYGIVKIFSQNGMTRISGQVSDVLTALGDKITVSTSAPASNQGKDGDIWLVVV